MFSSGIEYVVNTRRYLYPGTIDVYNELVLKMRCLGAWGNRTYDRGSQHRLR